MSSSTSMRPLRTTRSWSEMTWYTGARKLGSSTSSRTSNARRSPVYSMSSWHKRAKSSTFQWGTLVVVLLFPLLGYSSFMHTVYHALNVCKQNDSHKTLKSCPISLPIENRLILHSLFAPWCAYYYISEDDFMLHGYSSTMYRLYILVLAIDVFQIPVPGGLDVFPVGYYFKCLHFKCTALNVNYM